MARSTLDVLTDHLNRRQAGDVDDDLAANYADDVVYLRMCGKHSGHDGVREMANLLATQLPDAAFQYPTIEVHEDLAFREWNGLGEKTPGTRRSSRRSACRPRGDDHGA